MEPLDRQPHLNRLLILFSSKPVVSCSLINPTASEVLCKTKRYYVENVQANPLRIRSCNNIEKFFTREIQLRIKYFNTNCLDNYFLIRGVLIQVTGTS